MNSFIPQEGQSLSVDLTQCTRMDAAAYACLLLFSRNHTSGFKIVVSSSGSVHRRFAFAGSIGDFVSVV